MGQNSSQTGWCALSHSANYENKNPDTQQAYIFGTSMKHRHKGYYRLLRT